MPKKAQVKRTLRINMNDGTHKDLVIGKAVSMKTTSPARPAIYLESLPDGTFQFCWDDRL